MKGKHVWLTSVLVVAMLSIAAVTSAFAAPKLTVEKSNAPIPKSVDISQQSSGAVTVMKKPVQPVIDDTAETSSRVTVDGKPVHALQLSKETIKEIKLSEADEAGVLATYHVDITLPGQTLARISDSNGNPWHLTRGEEVTLSLSWLPRDAALRVGLIDSDNTFHYVNFTGGADAVTFSVNVADDYRVGIYNTDTHEAEISGDITI
ncbi:conserved exported hypothetical protein [[Clostridium] ultunense Esp]|nr:conserved exported hypothetical protein [[Clostridium] ultunense Esp]